MNILFLTLGRIEQRGIYSCLIDKMKAMGDNVFVVSPIERKYKKETSISEKNNIKILKVKSGNIQKVNKIEKGISTIRLQYQIIKAIRKYFKDIKFDLVIYSTPPITFSKVIKFIKKRDDAKSYLMLKDIFPQNAVDLDMIKREGLIHKYFRLKEIDLYKNSDFIGCMSKANVNYLIEHNNFIEEQKVEVLPNTITPENMEYIGIGCVGKIRKKYNIPLNKKVFIYGGNLGKPQGIDFILECINENEKRNNTFLLVIGSGTEYEKVSSYIIEKSIKNTRIYSYMPKDEYDNIVKACDAGLVFLDKRFTIPNIPSRILTYMEYSMPIIAATDKNTDLESILVGGNFGLWSESGKVEDFFKNLDMICNDSKLSEQMGTNGRRYLEQNYTSDIAYEIIMKHFK
ncbi:group 1 glycosyl transferase family [[Clostridium] sordellii]|uniref:glycosyltransferase family 4 protein n=1 Tax=Paraclostridium sordellii TaxID=1505 RepID=UPI0005E1CB15|nr:glycosyltransferase family 4 protein [Paeniclostridium sordellii]CEP91042.1 group 1 glycosyl transferase family [[Clostridium] sordellii] [Paeniclostridium sordellii]